MSEPKKTDAPRIAEFYNGRSVFMTGAAGFLGVVLLETLLRCCAGIKTIYILIREKKGSGPESRREEIFRRKIFTKLRNENPKVFEKVRVVAGDVAKPNMDLGEEETWAKDSIMHEVINEVSIVFHCAASINFLRPFSYLVQHNVGGTYNVIQLCRKMKKIKALIYSSTAYCNTNRKSTIEERVYGMPYPPQRFLETAKLGDEAKLAEMVAECQPPWPNFYCLSKCISECLLEQVKDFQVIVVRPALICQSWKGPMPGYAEENSNLAQLCLGIGKGFLKVLAADESTILDLVPCDIVANAHIVSAWHSVVHNLPSPLIINCTSYGTNHTTIANFSILAQKFVAKYPLPNTMRAGTYCIVLRNPYILQILSVLEHYVPAYGLDLLLRLKGKKPKLVALYRFLDKAMKTSIFFLSNSWAFEVNNFHELRNVLNPEDEEDFYVNSESMELEMLMENLHTGAPFYEWSIDKKPRAERLRMANQVMVITRIIQIAVVFVCSWVIYMLCSLITCQ